MIPRSVIEGYAYKRYTTAIDNLPFTRRQLELRDLDGSLMAYICGTMPESLKGRLLEYLLLSLGDEGALVQKDIDHQDRRSTFEALHFSWYNRHATRVRKYRFTIQHFY